MKMNAVGIDVSKGKSMVAILRPYGEIISSPFEIKHTFGNIQSLIKQMNSIEGESRIVMEHTGRYYESLARDLSLAGLFVIAINPKIIKDFSYNSLRKVKSDKADAIKIARYTLDSWTDLKQYSLMDETRNQLKTMNRQFGFYMKHKTAMKNKFIGILDQTYPGVNTFFDSLARDGGSQKWIDFATTYWHVDCVRKMSLNAFALHYHNWCKRKRYNFSKTKAEEIYGANHLRNTLLNNSVHDCGYSLLSLASVTLGYFYPFDGLRAILLLPDLFLNTSQVLANISVKFFHFHAVHTACIFIGAHSLICFIRVTFDQYLFQ